MKIKGEDFVNISDFARVINRQFDCFIEKQFKDKALTVARAFEFDIDEKKFEKWLRQAAFLEKFSPEDIKDAATKNLVFTMDKELAKYKNWWQTLKTFLVEEKQRCESEYEKNGFVFYKNCAQFAEFLLSRIEDIEKGEIWQRKS